jgi:hypothetical protein
MRKIRKNLTGMSFGLLSVTGDCPGLQKHHRWMVHCLCGTDKPVREDSLLDGSAKSCGCASNRFKKSKMEKRYNLTNKRFGSLWVVWRSGSAKAPSGASHSLWTCQCACGNLITVKGEHLNSGRKENCGGVKHKKPMESVA